MSSRLVVGYVPNGETSGDALLQAQPLLLGLKASTGTVSFRVYAFDQRGAAIAPPSGGTSYFSLSCTNVGTRQSLQSLLAATYAGYTLTSSCVGVVLSDVSGGGSLWYNFAAGSIEPNGIVADITSASGGGGSVTGYVATTEAYGILPNNGDCGALINTLLQGLKATVSTGGRACLLLAAGTFQIGDVDIELPANVTMESVGGDFNVTVLRAKDNATITDALLKSEGFNSLTFRSGSGVRGTSLRGITVDGNRANQPSNAKWRGVSLFGYDFTLESVRVTNCPGDGLWTEHNATSVQECISPINNCEFSKNGGYGWINRGPHDNKGRNNRFFNNGSPQSMIASQGWRQGRGGYWTAIPQSPTARVAVRSTGVIDGIACPGTGYRYHTILTWQSGDAPGGWAQAVVVSGAIVGWLLPAGATGFPASVSYTVKAICGLNAGSGFVATLTTDAAGAPTLAITSQGVNYTDGPMIGITGGGNASPNAWYIAWPEGGKITRCIPTIAAACTGGDGTSRGGGGTGYNTDPTAPVLCAITGGGGSGAYACARVSGGVVQVVSTGFGGEYINHQNLDVGNLVLSLAAPVGAGSGADLSYTLNDYGEIVAFPLATRGSGYTPSPTENQGTTVQATVALSVPQRGAANSGINPNLQDATGTILTDSHSWGDQTYAYRLSGGSYLVNCTLELGGFCAVKIEGNDCTVKVGRGYSNGFITNPWYAAGVGGLTGLSPGACGIVVGDGTYAPKDINIEGVNLSNFHCGGVVVANSGGNINVSGCTHRLAAGLSYDFGYTNTSLGTYTDSTVQYANNTGFEISVNSSGQLNSPPEVARRSANSSKRFIGNEQLSLGTTFSSAFRVLAGNTERFSVTGASSLGAVNTGSIGVKPASAGDFSVWMGDGFSSRHRFMPSGQVRWGRLAGAGGNDPSISWPAGVSTGAMDANATDMRGGGTFTTGASPAAAGATILTVTFRSSYGIAPYVIVQGRDLASAALGLYANTTGQTTFTIAAVNAPAASTAYSFTYWVSG